MLQKLIMEEANENKRYCSDCKTTKTPLWRGGPAGPKSLCNACGIRYRKLRRSQSMGIGNSMNHKAPTKEMSPSSPSSDGAGVKKQRRLREEEQAAFSLLALSLQRCFCQNTQRISLQKDNFTPTPHTLPPSFLSENL